MLKSKLGQGLACFLALSLAACGGSGSGGSSPNYDEHYDGIGTNPDIEQPGLSPDPEIADAVAPGYLGIAALAATLDLRMDLQAFEWAVPAMRRMAEDSPGPTGGYTEIECYFSSEAGETPRGFGGSGAIYHDSSGAEGATIFSFGECQPSSGTQLSSTLDARQLYRHQSSSTRHEFQLNQVTMHRAYPNLAFTTQGSVVREELERTRQHMLFTLADASEGNAQLRIEQAGADNPFAVLINSMRVETSKETPDAPAMVFGSSQLAFELQPGSRGSEERAGAYILETEGLTLRYEGGLGLMAGDFKVTAPDGSIYTYSFPNGADPQSLLQLNVAIDADGDGTIDKTGTLSQQLLMQRLRVPN